ncbi:hypothetical protein Scep_009644 [Stephania cephalantha]|uniref:Uncharacterized protein n=1 Tax=Stephania cephalantha TaxID=152367 RepID=A0AAP0JTJ7_9MAGN
MVWRDVTKMTRYHGHVGVHLLEVMVWSGVTRREWLSLFLDANHNLENANHECSGDDVLESGLRLAGTVIRRSTAWSRGNPRVCYAFVLVHRGEARPTAVSVCESRSRGRGDPRQSQGYMRRASSGGGRAGGEQSGGKGHRRRRVAAAAEIWGRRNGGKRRRNGSRPDGVGVRTVGGDVEGERRRRDAINGVHERRQRRRRRTAQQRARPMVSKRRRALRSGESARVTVDNGDGGGEDCAATTMGFGVVCTETWDEEEGLFDFYPFYVAIDQIVADLSVIGA